MKSSPLLKAGSVTIATVFHVVTEKSLSQKALARMNTMITAQMKVLNDAYAGNDPADAESGRHTAADTPFRFDVTRTTWTVTRPGLTSPREGRSAT
ncbi:MAG: hypothetical protein ABIU87_09355 [Ornithinibacter sp.]